MDHVDGIYSQHLRRQQGQKVKGKQTDLGNQRGSQLTNQGTDKSGNNQQDPSETRSQSLQQGASSSALQGGATSAPSTLIPPALAASSGLNRDHSAAVSASKSYENIGGKPRTGHIGNIIEARYNHKQMQGKNKLRNYPFGLVNQGFDELYEGEGGQSIRAAQNVIMNAESLTSISTGSQTQAQYRGASSKILTGKQNLSQQIQSGNILPTLFVNSDGNQQKTSKTKPNRKLSKELTVQKSLPFSSSASLASSLSPTSSSIIIPRPLNSGRNRPVTSIHHIPILTEPITSTLPPIPPRSHQIIPLIPPRSNPGVAPQLFKVIAQGGPSEPIDSKSQKQLKSTEPAQTPLTSPARRPSASNYFPPTVSQQQLFWTNKQWRQNLQSQGRAHSRRTLTNQSNLRQGSPFSATRQSQHHNLPYSPQNQQHRASTSSGHHQKSSQSHHSLKASHLRGSPSFHH